MLTPQGKITGAWRPTILLFTALLSACALGRAWCDSSLRIAKGR